MLDELVREIGMHGESHVGERGPGGGRPGDQIEIVADAGDIGIGIIAEVRQHAGLRRRDGVNNPAVLCADMDLVLATRRKLHNYRHGTFEIRRADFVVMHFVGEEPV